jgi:hypothetical protein
LLYRLLIAFWQSKDSGGINLISDLDGSLEGFCLYFFF